MMLLHYIVILFTNDRTIIPKMVIYQILINSNTNNVWEVLAGVTYTWDPSGFDTGKEGGKVLIGFLGALLPTSHPHTFPHSSSA